MSVGQANRQKGAHEETADGEGRRKVGSVELCDFFEQFESNGRHTPHDECLLLALHNPLPFCRDVLLNGVYSLGDLRQVGRERGWCPYFLARHLINFSHVVIYRQEPSVANKNPCPEPRTLSLLLLFSPLPLHCT